MILLGNLDVESHWARLLAPDRPPVVLPEAVLRRISAAATLLRVYASDGDRIWTPRPVDPDRVPDVVGLTRPELIAGPAPREAQIEWGQRGLLAARLNHKGWIRDLRGAEVEEIRSIEQLEGAWLLKDPLGAAGRGHLRGEGAPDEKQRRAIERRLERFGSLIREPWIERVADFGCAARVANGETEFLGLHRLLVDERGRFEGIGMDAHGLAAGEERQLRAMTAEVGARLIAAGYRGLFGIDACRDVAGEFHPLLEVNVRLTFGHVAWALARRLGAGELRFGAAVPDGGVPLLLPSETERVAAWIRV